jgi:hypothetical protein
MKKIVFYFSLAYILTSLLLVVDALTFGQGYHSLKGFSGPTNSRVDFSFIVGLLCIIIFNTGKCSVWMMLPICGFLLFISETRAAFISIIAVIIYYNLYFLFKGLISKNTVRIYLIRLIFILVVSLVFVLNVSISGRGIGFFDDTGLRALRIFIGLNDSLQHLLLGAGSLYTHIEIKGQFSEVHNNLIQSILDFGLPLTLLFIFGFLHIFKKLNIGGRLYIIFWLSFGFFHAGFSAFNFDLRFFAVVLLAVLFSKTKIGNQFV